MTQDSTGPTAPAPLAQRLESDPETVERDLFKLHDRMSELCEHYGFTMDDLNLDLGPLGSLLPQSSP